MQETRGERNQDWRMWLLGAAMIVGSADRSRPRPPVRTLREVAIAAAGDVGRARPLFNAMERERLPLDHPLPATMEGCQELTRRLAPHEDGTPVERPAEWTL